MRNKIAFTVRLLALMVAFCTVGRVWADIETVDGIEWTYTVFNGEASLGLGVYNARAVPQSTEGAITIPTTLGKYPVTRSGDFAFYGCSGLTSITIPDSVASIESSAFLYCSGLTAFVVSDGNPSYKSVSGLLLTKDGTTIIAGVNGEVTIPNSATSIGSSAFVGCSGLTNVTISDSVTNIGDYAFYDCSNLNSVTIGNAVTSIGFSAFVGCNNALYDMTTVPGVKIVDGWAVGNTDSISGFLNLTGIRGIGSYAFESCSGLTSVTIPDSVLSIGDYAFRGCSSLKIVTMSNFDISFGEGCFKGCPAYERAIYKAAFGANGSGVEANEVSLTVTNVVVHYVSTSVTSEAVTPSEETGLVNIIAEVRAENKPVAISSAWADQYGEAFTAKFGDDFAAAITAQTGKKDGAGNAMCVWQDYVAGTDPTDEDDVFKASITFDKETGEPVISWTPELSETEAAKRSYRKFGKVSLKDDDWMPIDGDNAAGFNFFKVTVEMK